MYVMPWFWADCPRTHVCLRVRYKTLNSSAFGPFVWHSGASVNICGGHHGASARVIVGTCKGPRWGYKTIFNLRSSVLSWWAIQDLRWVVPPVQFGFGLCNSVNMLHHHVAILWFRDRPGVRQVPEGSMEETGCEIICGASTTLVVKG